MSCFLTNAGKDIKSCLIWNGTKDFARAFRDTSHLTVTLVSETDVSIDMNNVIGYGNSASRAGLDAHFAADTADFANVFDFLAKTFGRAGNIDFGFSRHNLDDLFGAGFGAFAATHAAIGMNERHAITHFNGFKRTGFCAVTHSYAGVLAFGRTAVGDIGSSARFKPDVIMFVRNVTILSIASNSGDRIFAFSHFFSGNASDFCADGFFSGETKIGRNIRVVDDGSGISFTTGITASTALSLRQNFHDLFDFRIFFDCEFMSSQSQANAKEKADRSKESQPGEGNLNEIGLHVQKKSAEAAVRRKKRWLVSTKTGVLLAQNNKIVTL